MPRPPAQESGTRIHGKKGRYEKRKGGNTLPLAPTSVTSCEPAVRSTRRGYLKRVFHLTPFRPPIPDPLQLGSPIKTEEKGEGRKN